MGLLDVINGMQNGPRGEPTPKGSEGMSVMTKAILALLAYKAVKHLGGGQPEAHPAGDPPAAPTPLPGNTVNAGFPGGGLGDLLKGGLVVCLRAGPRETFSAAASAICLSNSNKAAIPRLPIRG